MSQLRSNLGYFITLEGIEGVGKSTAVKFMKSYLEQQNIPITVTREPGGTPIAEAIRHILLTHHPETMSIDTELLLLFAGRAQHLVSVIRPALASGSWVISDRFTDASFAYQGGGRGIDKNRIALLEEWVQGDLRPDLTILLLAPIDIALQRTKFRNQLDRIESERLEFFQKVQDVYLERAKQDPTRFCIINANQPLHKVQNDLQMVLHNIIKR